MLYIIIGLTVVVVALAGTVFALQTKMTRLKKDLANEANTKTSLLENRIDKIKNVMNQSMTALADVIDGKDICTNGHSLRVAKYSKMIAERMGKSEQDLEDIYIAALLHDVGKMNIPDEIINKAAKLNNDEYAVIKTHPTIGYSILKNIEDMPEIAMAARYHHERYDGNGYPSGMKGDKIPEIARIIAVADAYDAMTSDRSYRKLMEQDKVYQEIEKGKGNQFDPKMAQIMLNIMEEDTAYTFHG